jgi:FKBP12-rapamycin complex-associated protein
MYFTPCFHSVIVRIQMLAELDEIIDYKLSHDNTTRLATIRKTWMNRLNGCQRNVEVWQRILKVRFLVISPEDDMEMWIKFANLCRKSGRLNVCQKTLSNLLNLEPEYLSNLVPGSIPHSLQPT